MRLVLAVLLAAAGVVAGAATAFTLQTGAADVDPGPTPTPVRDVVASAPAPEPETRLMLVWTPGGLPPGAQEALAGLPGIRGPTVVRGDTVGLVASRDADGHVVDETEPGWIYPLDGFAIDPSGYADLLPKGTQSAVAGLAPGEALLSATSADLRGIGPGGELELATGTTVTVTAVVDDTLVGAAEIILHLHDAERAGITTERFMLLDYDGDRAAVEATVRDALPEGVPVRMRGPGEAPYLRHGDAVLPQALVKATFGEFAYRPPEAGRDIVQDPDWVAENIVDVEVPILGAVRCHRGIAAALRGALDELESRGLSELVDPEGYAGCWAPRLVVADGDVSRHAWGITVDLNAHRNPTGEANDQDPRLVDTFARWGFTWGGFWLIPDPMHFEYLEPPGPDAVKVPGG